MGLFGKQIKEAGEGVGEVIGEIANLVDQSFTSKEEKGEIIAKLQAGSEKLTVLLTNAATERHETDMKSDNKLSKNIRPLVLTFLMLVLFLTVLVYVIWGVQIPITYLKLIENWGDIAIMFYFGSRAVEKSGAITGAINLFSKKKR